MLAALAKLGSPEMVTRNILLVYRTLTCPMMHSSQNLASPIVKTNHISWSV
ncbi:MAG TPA: hypothetical protein PLZ21_01250 [Armatimonadota bacterium]|nr:hypothetical protein [Armatimonadota bacterium]